jgi:hypothetical protein
MKPWRLLKVVEGSVLKYRVPLLWPTYISERRTAFTKAYRINVTGYWELFEEHVRNLGTLETPLPRRVIVKYIHLANYPKNKTVS